MHSDFFADILSGGSAEVSLSKFSPKEVFVTVAVNQIWKRPGHIAYIYLDLECSSSWAVALWMLHHTTPTHHDEGSIWELLRPLWILTRSGTNMSLLRRISRAVTDATAWCYAVDLHIAKTFDRAIGTVPRLLVCMR
jgi:hypothetical protein